MSIEIRAFKNSYNIFEILGLYTCINFYFIFLAGEWGEQHI